MRFLRRSWAHTPKTQTVRRCIVASSDLLRHWRRRATVLRIERLGLVDFGPFKGRQALDLPADPGVVVVYGENMRGKTSLLNAIRFALFGKVLGRGRREGSLHQIGNWENASEGKFGFEVALEFSTEGHAYRLTRS